MGIPLLHRLARRMRRLRDEESGVVAVETMMITPFLIVGLFMSYEFFDLYQQQSLREKATYTVADALSRETAIVDDTYIDNIKTTFDMIVRARGDTQLRISVVRFHASAGGSYELRWSEVRGDGPMQALTQAGLVNAAEVFPFMINGQDLILVESEGVHVPTLARAIIPDQQLNTRMFMTLRFASQLCFEGVCTPVS